ncbi:conserved exported hypothetical protein [Gammaproteobacteria bacterium]
MSKKMNQHKSLFAFKVGLLIGNLVASQVMAAECGQAKLIEAASVGVSVINNTCQEPSKLAIGSVLALSSGSRVWLKFDPNSKGEGSQLICQNKSLWVVNVNLAGTSSPWIKPQGLKNCELWKNNKLNCESQEGKKNGFFCAIANTKQENLSSTPEMTTSPKMRNLFQAASSAEDIIKKIKPDIELCKNLYNVSEKIEMSWTATIGMINNFTINSDNKDLIACVEGVVKQEHANKNISINYSF